MTTDTVLVLLLLVAFVAAMVAVTRTLRADGLGHRPGPRPASSDWSVGLLPSHPYRGVGA